MRKIGKKPSEYPQFAFRITKDLKLRLTELVEEVTNFYNQKKSDGEYLYRKNDIIAEALEKGLNQMKGKQIKNNWKIPRKSFDKEKQC